MAVTIQVRRGSKANLPTLAPGEWGLVTDQQEVYIGGNSGNIQVATQAALNALEQQVDNGTITAVQVTASASGWAGSPPSQSLTVAGMTADSLYWVGLNSTATYAQRDAARKAVIAPTAQGTSSLTLTCDGVTPTVDLPILVFLSGGAS